MESHNLH